MPIISRLIIHIDQLNEGMLTYWGEKKNIVLFICKLYTKLVFKDECMENFVIYNFALHISRAFSIMLEDCWLAFPFMSGGTLAAFQVLISILAAFAES